MVIKDYKNYFYSDLGGPIELEISGKKVSVPLPSKTSDEWVVVKSESVEVDKQGFMLKEWNKTYGIKHKVKDFTQLANICSTNKSLSEWYALASLRYSQATQVPLYVKEEVDPAEYAKISSIITALNDVNSEKQNLLDKEYKKFEEARKRIEAEAELKIKQLKSDNVPVKILTINKTTLPISILLQIDNFNPKENPDVMKDLFAREMLINYKKSLFKLHR